jgi:hypothetical protein
MHATAPAPVVFPVFPVVRVRRPQTVFRGTRLLTGLVLAFAGTVALAFAGLAVPLAQAIAFGDVDRGLLAALSRIAPYVIVIGGIHLVAAVGIWADRRWGYTLGTWMVAFGVLASMGGLVVAIAGRDPFAAVGGVGAAGDGIGILLWSLVWYGVAAWGIQRVVAAREL